MSCETVYTNPQFFGMKLLLFSKDQINIHKIPHPKCIINIFLYFKFKKVQPCDNKRPKMVKKKKKIKPLISCPHLEEAGMALMQDKNDKLNGF